MDNIDRTNALKILEDLLETALPILLKTIEDHRSKVSVISKRENFYLNFSVEKIDEYGWYSLCLMCGSYLRSESYYPEDSIEHYLLAELFRTVATMSKRFKDVKYFKLFYHIATTSEPLHLVRSEYLLSPRIYYGNLEKVLPDFTAIKFYSVRALTPRRVKRKEFRRGYRDHGSMSSESERARREARPDKTPEEIFWAIHTNLYYYQPEPLSLNALLSEARENLPGNVMAPETTEPSTEYDQWPSTEFKERKERLLRKYRKENLDFLREHPEDSEPFK